MHGAWDHAYNEIVFDDRIESDSPRNARRELKKLLGLQSLSGIVYSITEVPIAMIREIVDARIVELAGGSSLQTAIPADMEEVVMARLKPILARLATLDQGQDEVDCCTRLDPLEILPEPIAEPDWSLVKRHFRRYGNPSSTAAKYGINLRELNARARMEGWAS